MALDALEGPDMDALTADETMALVKIVKAPWDHYCAISDPGIFTLAALALAECAKPERGGWLMRPCQSGVRPIQWDGNTWVYVPRPAIKCDHTKPMSVATAQCRACLGVLT